MILNREIVKSQWENWVLSSVLFVRSWKYYMIFFHKKRYAHEWSNFFHMGFWYLIVHISFFNHAATFHFLASFLHLKIGNPFHKVIMVFLAKVTFSQKLIASKVKKFSHSSTLNKVRSHNKDTVTWLYIHVSSWYFKKYLS